MRILSRGIIAGSCLAILAAPALAGPQTPALPAFDSPGLDLLVPRPVFSSPELDKQSAGLPIESRPEVLTWERVFALALIRFRAGDGPAAETLVPSELDLKAKKSNIDDFSRFRTDFLATNADSRKTFRDPSTEYFRLLRRLQSITSSRKDIAFHENLYVLLRELVQGASSGLSQIDIDRVGAALERARQRLNDEVGHYRNDLDHTKVAFGLSPHAAVVPDRLILTAFDVTFEGVDQWHRNPQRTLDQLPKLVDRLPVLGDVTVGGRPLSDAIRPDPNAIDGLLADATREAIKNRGAPHGGQVLGNAEVQLELQIRRQVRHLLEIKRAYNGEKRSYELAIRLKDQTLERVVGPASGVTIARSPMLDTLLDHQGEIRTLETRLVRLWTEFRAERLALYRGIGVLPYHDWKAFYGDLSAVAAEKPVPPGNKRGPDPGRQPPPAGPDAGPRPPTRVHAADPPPEPAPPTRNSPPHS
jgi:hypothetical protein